MSNNSLMIPFFFLLLFPGCDCSGSIITGFLDEPLDLYCTLHDTKQLIEKLIVILNLSNATDTTKTKFVSYDDTRVCNKDHWLYNVCLSQVTSYLTKDDNRAHFVIRNPPPTLNNCETYCAYEYKYQTTEDSLSPGPVRTIKLRASITTDSFIDQPDEEVYSNEGSDVTLEWHFHVGFVSRSLTNGVFEFLFGVWDDPGFVRNKILAVQERNKIYKQKGFEGKVNWSGNIYDCVYCTARVKMYNLTFADFKKYGVEVELSLDRSPLRNWLRLVKFEPAKIINSSWLQRIEVEEGNATTIECEATGRPTPSVIIKKRNRTLCHNSTGHCVLKILEAKPEDEGEYLCLVQQRNYNQIRRSLNLTVVKGRNTINTTQDKFRNTMILIALTAVGFLLVLVVIVFLFKRAKFCKSDSEQRQLRVGSISKRDCKSTAIPPLKDEKEVKMLLTNLNNITIQ